MENNKNNAPNENKDQKPQEVKPEDAENNDVNSAETAEKDDRPEANYKAELDRKTRELERLRMEMSLKNQEPRQRDPNDMTTWSDHELKAVINNPHPDALPYKEKANDILLDRKVDARLARERETNKRVTAEMQLRQQFPEALDPSSELAAKMEQILNENDLSRTPAGRLVAAKLASAELNQGKNTSVAKGQKSEQTRVARVKGQMVDGDRPKPTDNVGNLDEKRQNLATRLMKASQPGKVNDEESTAAMSEILKDRFGGRKGFFGDR